MPSFINNQNVQAQAGQYLDIPEEAMRKMPDVINKNNNTQEPPSLLSTAGWSAAATGIFQAKPLWDMRELPNNINNLSRIGSHARAFKNLGTGSIAGAAMTAPTDYLVGKMSDKYRNDKEFNAGHFAAIAAPAAVSGTIGTGALMNTMHQMKNSGKIGTKQMVKNIVSPTKILGATKREMSNIVNMLKTRRFGAGLLAAGMMGLSAIEPLQYIAQTRKKKPEVEKTASIKSKASKLKDSVEDYIERKRRIGLGVVAAGSYFGAKNFIEDRKKKIEDFNKKRLSMHGIRKELTGEVGLLY